MKVLKWLLIIFFILSCKGYGYSQAKQPTKKSIIHSKIVILRHETQTDTLRLPIVSGEYPALKSALSDKNLFNGDSLPDVIKNYQSCGCGITSLNYKVTFEGKGIISIILYFDTMGTYPDTYQQFLTFNISTGKTYSITNDINAKGLKWIFDGYKTTLSKRIDEDQRQNDDSQDSLKSYNYLKDFINHLEKDELLKNYVFTTNGVLFTTERILPHAIQNREPDRDWFVPFTKLKIYRQAGSIILR